jgi:RNA polymerase sigma-70 factor (ECF subfamily)
MSAVLTAVKGLQTEPLRWPIRSIGPDSVANSNQADDPLERRSIEAVRSGDPDAYDYLVSKYMRRAVSIAWGIVRNGHDAEDLAQEAFVKAYESLGRFRTGQSFGPWIYRIVTNLSLDVVKHRRRVRREPLSDTLEGPRSDRADLRASSSELALRIDEAIETLPDMQRIVARLFLVEQFSHSEIAAITSLNEGTIRSHLSLARRKLQDRLGDLYGARS